MAGISDIKMTVMRTAEKMQYMQIAFMTKSSRYVRYAENTNPASASIYRMSHFVRLFMAISDAKSMTAYPATPMAATGIPSNVEKPLCLTVSQSVPAAQNAAWLSE